MALNEQETLLVQRLRELSGDLEALLKSFVSLNSHTDNFDGVTQMGQLVDRHLSVSGFRVAAFVTGLSGQHLVARSGHFEGNKLMLLGHLDTVFPQGSLPDTLEPCAKHPERRLGPGASDMKGGLVIMLAAIRVLAEEGLLDERCLTVVLCADEETGSPTGHDIIAQEAEDHHLCLVFETGSELGPKKSTIVAERKGCGRIQLDIRGVASHSGARKEEGHSAALEAAHKTIALEALNDFERGNTVNVGLVSAGTAANTVPEHAKLEIDYRFAAEAEGLALEAAMNEIFEKDFIGEGAKGQKIETQVTRGPRHQAMVRSEAVDRMIKRLQVNGSDLGLELVEEYRGGSSDGNITSSRCPTVDGLGSVGGKIHSAEEWVNIDSLADRAALLAISILRFYEL